MSDKDTLGPLDKEDQGNAPCVEIPTVEISSSTLDWLRYCVGTENYNIELGTIQLNWSGNITTIIYSQGEH